MLGRKAGLVLPEIAVYSGDTVRMDEDGFLYFIGRRDEMMKTSGYRVSPTEIEEILYATRMVGECVAFSVNHDTLGQAIQVIATPPAGSEIDTTALLAECRVRMPAYLVPSGIGELLEGPLPRNPNGKIDRKTLCNHVGRETRLILPGEMQSMSVSNAHFPYLRPDESVRGGCGPVAAWRYHLQRLAARVGQTPFYAYDRKLLSSRVAELRAALPKQTSSCTMR